MTHHPPEFQKEQFNCPHCGVYAHQNWSQCWYTLWQRTQNTALSVSHCVHCKEEAYWYKERMIIPSSGDAPLPAPDMPDSCKVIFLEAREVAQISPKGAAALLRLCVQELMVEFGKPGKNINKDIAALVKEGLPPLVQQSLDVCRVVGNNAVHPGEINLDDTPEITHSLFRLINLIVHDRITQPREVQKLYEALPPGALEAIQRRDGEGNA